MIIAPEILVTPDRPAIRFREPREKIDLGKELQRVLAAQGWGIGTYFNVQFISHDRTELLSQGEFVVTKDAEQLQTSEEDPRSPRTRTAHIRKIEQLGEFRVFSKNLEGEKAQPEMEKRIVSVEEGLLKARVDIEELKKPKKRGRPKTEPEASKEG